MVIRVRLFRVCLETAEDSGRQRETAGKQRETAGDSVM
jgi:hypothetical protein